MKKYLPLKGIRILSFEVAATLPACTRVLADLGAEVVRVGQPQPARGEYMPTFEDLAINKARISINLRNEEGRQLAARLVEKADAVCSNFTPPVMRRFGFDYESLRQIKPSIIFFQLSGFGSPGPWQDFPAYGPIIQAAAGLNAATGRPGDPPVRVGSHHFTDQVAGRYAALALLSALLHRDKTGEGQAIDLSMYAAACHILGDVLLETAAEGKAPPRTGNRHTLHAPQGVYPCVSEDQWVALTVLTDQQWQDLRGLLDADSLGGRHLDSVAERQACHDLIDQAIAAWTSVRSREECCLRLRPLGIPVAPVRKASDILTDKELRQRGAIRDVDHEKPILGYLSHPHATTAWSVDGFDRPILHEAHGHGADNEAVLRRWLQLSRREVKRLTTAGALLPEMPILIGEEPLLGMEDWPLDPDFADRLGLKPA